MVTEKLTRDNFLVWEAVVLPAVRAARMVGNLDGSIKAPSEEIAIKKDDSGQKIPLKEENPAYVVWNKRDQQVLVYLLGQLSVRQHTRPGRQSRTCSPQNQGSGT